MDRGARRESRRDGRTSHALTLAGLVSAGRNPHSSESPVMNQEREEERRMRPARTRMMSRREMRARSSWEMSLVVEVGWQGEQSDGVSEGGFRARRFGLGDGIVEEEEEATGRMAGRP